MCMAHCLLQRPVLVLFALALLSLGLTFAAVGIAERSRWAEQFAPARLRAKETILDSFLRSYLSTECKALTNCRSVRYFPGYNKLSKHAKAQAVTTRVLRAFSLLFVKLNISWTPLAGTLLGVVRHKGWIPWDHDMDIMMTAQDTHAVASHLHLLPRDLSMVHPLVDGATMGYGVYKKQCRLADGYGFDRFTGVGNGTVPCKRKKYWNAKTCLYSSLRDLNSCRPTTDNIVNGLSVDIFVPPRSHECGDSIFMDMLQNQTTAMFHGWVIPVPMDPHKYLSNAAHFQNYGKRKDYMVIKPRPDEMAEKLDPDTICRNWRDVLHKQHLEVVRAASNSEWRGRSR